MQEKLATLQESHDPNTELTKMWQNLKPMAHSNLTMNLGAFSSEWYGDNEWRERNALAASWLTSGLGNENI